MACRVGLWHYLGQIMKDVMLPGGLQSLTLGDGFNESMERAMLLDSCGACSLALVLMTLLDGCKT